MFETHFLLLLHLLFYNCCVATGLEGDVPAQSAVVRSKDCIIVGGGPIGLAAALTLSNPPHGYNVKVLEKTENAYQYDSTMAYHYNLNPRGLAWCDTIPKVSVKLEERGLFSIGGGFANVLVPGNPLKPIPAPRKMFRLMQGLRRRSCFVQRHTLLILLHESCREQERDRSKTKNESVGSIEVLNSKSFESIDCDECGVLIVKCGDGSTYSASLVVAADGIDSSVRSCLTDKTKSGWLQSKKGKLALRKYKSPSTGLRVKTLKFPPGMNVPNTSDSSMVMEATTFYNFRSLNNGCRNKLSLSCFPMKSSNMIRPAISVTRPDNEVWLYRNGSAIKQFYEKSFPRINFDNIMNDKEWDEFAKSNGITFPLCQYSPGSAVSSPERDTGVVLLGDACHAFPPDAGQGVNAGFQDVIALDRALRG